MTVGERDIEILAELSGHPSFVLLMKIFKDFEEERSGGAFPGTQSGRPASHRQVLSDHACNSELPGVTATAGR